MQIPDIRQQLRDANRQQDAREGALDAIINIVKYHG